MTGFDPTHTQERLKAAGYEIGAMDGVAGKLTYAGIFAYVARRPLAILLPHGEAAAMWLPHYGIADSVARLANFVGQAVHESGNFRYTSEIWGPTKAQRGYEGRSDLGNIQPGDGYTFRGRGIFQLTGRANYRAIGDRVGHPLEDNPALAERPDIAMLIAGDFWSLKNLNELADSGLEDKITKRINGGVNGLAERRALVARAKGLLT